MSSSLPTLTALALACAPVWIRTQPPASQEAASQEAVSREDRATPQLALRDADGNWRPAAELDVRSERALAALLDGDLELAHRLLGEELVERHLASAAEAIEAGDPPAALTRLDRALALAPDEERVVLARGAALIALGEQGIAQGQQGLFTLSAFEDALATYATLGRSPGALLGRARAAYMLNRSDDAAAFAREAAALLPAGTTLEGPSGMSSARILADSVYLAYADEAQRSIQGDSAADPEREQALFDEAALALDALIATEPDDPATWNRGVDLMLFRAAARDEASARADALRLVELGLERNPGAPELTGRLSDVARRTGGLEASVDAWERYWSLSRDPVARFNMALETFELGMRDFPAEGAPESEFEQAFVRFGQAESWLFEVDGDEALAWRVIARLGAAWTAYWAGDLERAERNFLSTAEMVAGGLEYFLPERLSPARLGLEYVVSKHVESEDLISAARVAGELQLRYPDNPDFANNSGFLNRDAATGLENLARAFCRASRPDADDPEALERLRNGLGLELEPGSDAERARFREEAERLLAQARRTMRASAAAYIAAAALAPEDVRVQNDAALISVYYLHDELDAAEVRLLECVRLGEQQLADADQLDAQALYDLKNAFGDALENLGVLALEFRGDPEAAADWFARAEAIGPDPRPIVTEYWIARTARAAAGETLEPSHVTAWGSPCQ